MNKERLQALIQKKDIIPSGEDMPMLKELTTHFPWFASVYVLQARQMMAENHIFFEKELPHFACYAGNREVLYDYLHAKPEAVEAITAAPEETYAPAIDAPEEHILNDLPGAPVETLIAEEETSAEPILAKEPVSTHFEPADETQSESIIDAAADLAIEMPERPTDIDGENQLTIIEENPVLQETLTNVLEEKEEIPVLVEKRLYTFGEWLCMLAPVSDKNEENLTQLPKPNELAENQPVAESPSPVQKIAAKPEKDEVLSIIDKFIREEPKIKRPQPAKFFKPEDMAEASVREDFTLATETLANIYIQQELYDKAIEIFTQLKLRYPQKSGYFAHKIEELKKKKEC
jgi:hypothetical protein